MKYYIDLNQLLFNITLNEESDIIFKLFSQKYIKNNYGNANCILNCNHKFINYSLENTLVCNKCFQLFNFEI